MILLHWVRLSIPVNVCMNVRDDSQLYVTRQAFFRLLPAVITSFFFFSTNISAGNHYNTFILFLTFIRTPVKCIELLGIWKFSTPTETLYINSIYVFQLCISFLFTQSMVFLTKCQHLSARSNLLLARFYIQRALYFPLWMSDGFVTFKSFSKTFMKIKNARVEWSMFGVIRIYWWLSQKPFIFFTIIYLILRLLCAHFFPYLSNGAVDWIHKHNMQISTHVSSWYNRGC